jgi:hypothetical protein
MSEAQEMQEIEISLEAAKEHLELAKALARLKDNADFKKLFTEKYIESYAARLVRLKASQGLQDEKNQMNIINQINGIGQFNQYMLFIEQEGALAEKAIEDMEAERDALNDVQEV